VIVEVPDVRCQRARDEFAVGVAGGQVGGQRLEHPPRFQELLVRGAGQLEVERHRAGQVHRRRRADDRPASRPAPDADDPLRLEQAQRLAQRLPADAVLLDHLGLEWQPVPRLQAVLDDVAGDGEGDDLGRLPHGTRHAGSDHRSIRPRLHGCPPSRHPDTFTSSTEHPRRSS
jgi:hypothetical protein